MEKIYSGAFHERLELKEAKTDLFLNFEERAHGSLEIFVDDPAETIDLHLQADAFSTVRIFFQIRTTHETHVSLQADVKKDANIHFGALDLSEALVHMDVRGELREQGATMEYDSGQLCLKDAKKYNDIELIHHAPHTYGDMHNFAVTFNDGFYDTVAAGRIHKGCFGSESHQETRVLTMGKDHMAKVLPILYIDENDVKASHALTVGQPDAQQLYYLQSRGLSKEQAVGLLSIGYFMPVIDLVGDEALHDALRIEMEKRVGLYGHS